MVRFDDGTCFQCGEGREISSPLLLLHRGAFQLVEPLLFLITALRSSTRNSLIASKQVPFLPYALPIV
jgi:hypothetical protein